MLASLNLTSLSPPRLKEVKEISNLLNELPRGNEAEPKLYANPA